DDTAVHSAGSLEQVWLKTWAKILPKAAQVSFYPGADEVGAVLLARALKPRGDAPVKIALSCVEPGGWDRVADYENLPLLPATTRQVEAAGGEVADEAEADVVLVMHAPAPPGYGRGHVNFGADGPDPALRTADEIAAQLDAGHRVALADVRYTNGSDPSLTAELEKRGHLSELLAYGGWNTAGNTTGVVVATIIAAELARRAGTLDDATIERLRLIRILEDSEYQAVFRNELEANYGMDFGKQFATKADEAAAQAAVTRHLQATVDRLTEPARWRVQEVTFPWNRLFEIELLLSMP
ncbi:MAG TPA: DUF4127 family protein, partial [Actinomycetales bacterium]|nr:DUF4127 family protein [Actinomycetales bacterium]